MQAASLVRRENGIFQEMPEMRNIYGTILHYESDGARIIWECDCGYSQDDLGAEMSDRDTYKEGEESDYTGYNLRNC